MSHLLRQRCGWGGVAQRRGLSRDDLAHGEPPGDVTGASLVCEPRESASDPPFQPFLTKAISASELQLGRQFVLNGPVPFY